MKTTTKLIRGTARPVEGLWLVTGMTLLALVTNSQLIQADTTVSATSVTAAVTTKQTSASSAGTEETQVKQTASQSSSSQGSVETQQLNSESSSAAKSSSSVSSSAEAQSSSNIESQSKTETSSVKSSKVTSSSASSTTTVESGKTTAATAEHQASSAAPTTQQTADKQRVTLRSRRSIQPTIESAAVTPTTATTDTVVIDGKTVVNYAGYDAVKQAYEDTVQANKENNVTQAVPREFGLMGTSEWWIDGNGQKLHLGAGTLADTKAKFNEDGSVVTWGNIKWHDIPNFEDRNFMLILEGQVKAGVDATGLFSHLFLQNESILNNLLDTSQTQSMAYMFADDSAPLGNYDLSYLNTAQVTDMTHMFAYSRGFEKINLAGINTGKVKSMHGMFQQIGASEINLTGFDTSMVTDMSDMFNQNENLANLDLSSFNTERVTNMARMFSNDYRLLNLDMTSFNTSHVTDMSGMFSGVQLVRQLDFRNFDTSQVTNMSKMFWGTFLKGNPVQHIIGLEGLNTSRVVNMAEMFHSDNLIDGMADSINHFDTRSVTDMSDMFNGISGEPQNWQPLFSTVSVQNMSQMFANTNDLISLNLTNFDTHNVTDMAGMFSNDSNLVNVTFSPLFRTPNVTNMSLMFFGDGQLQSLDLSTFDMKKVQPNFINNNQYQLARYIYTLGLFNVPMPDTDDVPAVKLRELKLNATTRLAFPGRINSVEDIGDITSIQDIIGSEDFTVEQYLSVVLQVLGFSDPTDLSQYSKVQSAGLNDAKGLTGNWLNTRTGEVLTAEQLMDRYSDQNAAFVTTDTWIWQNIVGQDVQLIADKNATWQPEDSFKEAVDDQGNQLSLADLNVTVTDAKTGTTIAPADLDLTEPGEYLVTFSTAADNGLLQTSGPLHLSVLPNQAAVHVHDAVIQLGTTWQAADNVDGVTDANGDTVPLTKLVTTGTVNVQVPGRYSIHYGFEDSLGNYHTATAVVIVNGLTLNAATHMMTTDETWQPLANVALAVNDQGETLEAKQVTAVITTADGQVVTKLNRPDCYTVTYQFSDGHGLHQQTAALTVTAGTNHATLTVAKNTVQLYTGDTWDARANLVAVSDSDGTPLDRNKVQITDPVDVAQAGTYGVTYQFTDLFGQTHRQLTTVFVLLDQADLQVKRTQVTLRAGDDWQPLTNLRLAVDSDGTVVALSRVHIEDSLNLATVGTYSITYKFVDLRGNAHVATTEVTVLPNEAQLRLKQTQINLTTGASWDALANVASARNVDGTTVPANQLRINDPVNTALVGHYQVNYWFVDQQQRCHSATAVVTISALVEPETPTEPSTPVEPEQPTEPSASVEPEQPTEPSAPVEPEQPTNPTQPVHPVVPSEPSQPVEPQKPMQPGVPVHPVAPTEPSQPVEPQQLMQPGVPVNPVVPSEPKQPVVSKVSKKPSAPAKSITVPVVQAKRNQQSVNGNKPQRLASALPQTSERKQTQNIWGVLLSFVALLTLWFPLRKK